MKIAVVSFLCVSALVVAAPAYAQDGEKSMLCKRAVIHNPLADVAAKPADPNTIVTTTVQIPLTIDLAKWLDMPMGTGGEGVLGLIELSDTGVVTYNGQDISAQVDAKCGNAPAVPQSTVKIDTDTAAPAPTVAAPAPVATGLADQPAPRTVPVAPAPGSAAPADTPE